MDEVIDPAPASVAPRPRERLFDRGPGTLGTEELLALILSVGDRQRPVLKVAQDLLAYSGGLRGLLRRSAAELMRQPGIGPVRAARLAAAFELTRRLETEGSVRGVPVRSGLDVHRLLAARLRDLQKEVFVALLLDRKRRLLREERVSEGTLDTAVVHPREVFGPAIREGASALIVVHNHPSGDPSPSREDVEITLRLVEVGALVGIELLDHVVLGHPGWVSMRERGLLRSLARPVRGD